MIVGARELDRMLDLSAPGDVGLLPGSGGVEVVDGSLCSAACRDECAGVSAQNRDPVAEIGGVVVAGGLLEPELCAPVGGSEFGDKFLGAVGVVTEPALEVAGESGFVTGPMDVFLSAPAALASIAPSSASGRSRG